MNSRRPLLLTAATLALASLAFGQGEVTQPSKAPGTPVGPRLSPALPSGAAQPGAPDPETPLMPDQTPSLVKPEETAAEADKKKDKVSKTDAFTQDLLTKIKFREVETKALADRAVQAQWDKSFTVKTDFEKRAILKEYYKLLYARMAKIDSSLKPQIDLKALDAEHRLTQERISPTEARDSAEASTSGRVFAE